MLIRRSKCGKSRLVPLHASTLVALTTYAHRRDRVLPRRTTPAFFVSEQFEAGYDIRTVQELLGHADVSTTMLYTHVLNRHGLGVRSPLDRL